MSGDFYAPQSAAEAVRIKTADKKAFFLAGGTVLNTWRKGRNIGLISLHRMGHNQIELKDGVITIGSMATLTEISVNNLFAETSPLREVSGSCRAISKNIRNMATLGGVLGSSFSRSDLLPVLLALDAHVLLLTEAGESSVPVADFLMTPPSASPRLILGVKIKSDDSLTLKTARFARSSNDLPVVKTACSYRCSDGKFKDLKIAAGGISDKPIRLLPLEMVLEGQACCSAKLKNAICSVMAEMKTPTSDLRGSGDFKKALAVALLEDILICRDKEACS